MPSQTIDVLLPFYGDVALMRQAVRSVQSQTDPAWRLVVVDDGQPDLSVGEWCASLGDDRIQYHRNDRNLGANGNYKKALGMAAADHLMMMGADDIMEPNYLQMVRTAFHAFPDAAMYHPGVIVVDAWDRNRRGRVDIVKQWLRPRVTEPTLLQGERLAVSLLRGNWTYFPAISWRRELIQAVGFREGFGVVQDLALILDLVCREESMILDPHFTFRYRRHAVSDSAMRTSTGQRFDEERLLHAQFAAHFRDKGWSRAARAATLRATSRVNAATVLPTTLRRGDLALSVRLLRHTFGGN